MHKVVFFGFGKLGVRCLESLIKNGFNIFLVMTHKDNDIDSVDAMAKKMDIEFSYLDSRKNMDEIREKIISIKPDLMISINYRYIIPKEIFTLAKYAINLHGSLLPKYRGRTPHVWSIINGEKEAGITGHLIDENVDTGDIITQIVIPIEGNDTGYSLLKKYEDKYPIVLMDSINKLINGEKLIRQDENLATYYGKRTPSMGYIDFRKSASEVVNFVRSQAEPYPGAYYYLSDGKKIIINRITNSNISDFDSPIGIIKEVDKNYYVRCNDNVLRIQEYRLL